MLIAGRGTFLFGLQVGWIAYWIPRLRASAFRLAKLATAVGVLGGGAVMALFKNEVLCGWYAIGLVVGFFAYFALGLLHGQQEVQPCRIEQQSYGREESPSSKQKGDARNATINWGPEAYYGIKLAHAQTHGGLAKGNCLSDRSRRDRAGSDAGAGDDRCVASDGAACFASYSLADLDCLSSEYSAGDGAEFSHSHCARRAAAVADCS